MLNQLYYVKLPNKINVRLQKLFKPFLFCAPFDQFNVTILSKCVSSGLKQLATFISGIIQTEFNLWF